MKRTFVNIAGKKFIAATAIAAMLSLSTANAAETKEASSKVEYIGAVNDRATFNVQFANENGAEFNLTVKNEAGEIIFTHKYNDKNFNKKVVIENLPENGSVTFAITGTSVHSQESFNINTATTVTSDVVVTKTK